MSADTHDHIPGYVGALAAFGTTVLAAAATLLVRGEQPPDSFRTSDLVLGALATQKFTRVITKDAVTTPLRAPSPTSRSRSAPARSRTDRVKDTGTPSASC